MPAPIAPILRALTARTPPKTILGFLLGVLIIAAVVAVTLVIALVDTKSLRWLAVCVVGFLGLLIAGLVVGVFRAASRDPSPLVLRELSGSDYVAIQQLLLGDSAAGESTAQLGAVVDSTASEHDALSPDQGDDLNQEPKDG